jgi:hypothetical protein
MDELIARLLALATALWKPWLVDVGFLALSTLSLSCAGFLGMNSLIGAKPLVARVVLCGPALAGTILFLLSALLYLTFDSYVDHIEPSVAIISWLLMQGQPPYTPIDDPHRYSLVYGPVLYIINGLTLQIFGPSIFVSKLGGVAAGVGSVLIGFLFFKRIAGTASAVLATGLSALVFLAFLQVAYWNRADSFIVLLVSLGLLASTLERRVLATALLGLSIGLAMGLKAHAIVYFLPVLGLSFVRLGKVNLLAALATASAIALLPFALGPISLENYVLWLRAASGHGLDGLLFLQNVSVAALLVVPAIAVIQPTSERWSGLRGEKLHYLAGLVGALAFVAIIAAKPGAGPHHFVPLVHTCLAGMLLLASGADVWRLSARGGLVLWVLISWVTLFSVKAVGVSVQAVPFVVSQISVSRDLQHELRFISNLHPDSRIEFGYTDDRSYQLTFVRPSLAFEQNAYLVDPPALMDMHLADMKIPDSTTLKLTVCEVEFWVLPSLGNPFSIRTAYPSGGLLFDPEFRQAFLENYRMIMQVGYFRVWGCARRAAPGRAVSRAPGR